MQLTTGLAFHLPWDGAGGVYHPLQLGCFDVFLDSWNCYHGDVNQSLMEATMDAMTATPHSVNGNPTSLKDLGFVNCGLDDKSVHVEF